MRSDPKGGGNIAMDGGESSETLVIEGGLASYALLTPALRARHGRLRTANG